MAVLGDSDVGIFVSTGGFTRDAQDEARRQERRRIMLLDLKRLFDLWVEYYDKILRPSADCCPFVPYTIWPRMSERDCETRQECVLKGKYAHHSTDQS